MNALIVYYSLSGTTRTVALALARELGADLEELRCHRYSRGLLGFLRASYDSWRDNPAPIEPPIHMLSHYDLVLVGGPIWAFHPATPVRAYLRQEASRLPDVAFFLTHGGSAAQASLREMEQLAGRPPIATLVLREAQVKQGFASDILSFAATLRTKKAA